MELKKEASDPFTYSDVALMSNGTEVMVAVYNGSVWTTERLTNNAAPDLAPVVATNGSRTVVAWRSVYPADALDPLNFSTQDSIVYRVYEDGVWTEVKTLYNGTSGAVKGLEAAMLADGTAAVTYSIDTDQGLEIIYAVVDNDDQVAKNVRMTNDSYLDQNPQITTVTFDDAQEWFVLGWHSVHDADGISVNDIRLCAFNQAGDLHPNFIDSISSVNEYANVNISSNFRFAKNSATISDLSILWTEQANSGDIDESSTVADKDVLKAVKFRNDKGRIYITSALEVAEMPAFTLIDHFDAYTTADNTVKAVILGTSYDNGYEPTGLTGESGGKTIDLLLAIPQSNLYTATGIFQNKLEIRLVAVDYESVIRGMRIPVQFTVFNAGIDPVNSITVQLGGKTTVFNDLYLLPNGSIPLTVYYDIPADRVINPPYTITAATNTISDSLYLAIPDVGISKLENLREEDGQRLLQVTLYNLSDVQLAGSDRIVKLGFYSDTDLTMSAMPTLTISNPAELALIDAGAYTKQANFNIKTFVGAGQEIPVGGVRIYVKAWIEEPLPGVSGTTAELLEYYLSNNIKSIAFESLVTRNGSLASISTEQTNEDGLTRALVTVKNNSLVTVSSGNLIVRLLNSSGQVLETLQSYDPELANNGLIELGAEGTATQEFLFSQLGHSVAVTYSNAVLTDDTNTNLAALSLNQIPLKFAVGLTEYAVTVQSMSSTIVSATTEDPEATVSINNTGLSSTQVPLAPGRNVVRVNVTAADGLTTQTYRVIVYNNIPGYEPPVLWPTIVHNAGGTVTVASDVRSITIKPNLGYRVKNVLVNYQSVGSVTTYAIPVGHAAYHIEVVFEQATGLLTVVHNAGGTVTLATDGLSAAITPDEGYRITDVLVDGTSLGVVTSYSVTDFSKKHQLEVIFARTLGKITIVHNTGGTVVVSAERSVSITPSPGYLVRDVLVDGQSVVIVPAYAFADSADHHLEVVFVPLGTVLSHLRDVGNHWAKNDIAFVVARRLIVGTSATSFSPNLPITRAMLVSILSRLGNNKAQGPAPFSDVAPGAWYAQTVAWAAETGIDTGVGNGRFAPDRSATREELAVIFYNYCRYAGIELPKTPAPPFADSATISDWAREAVTAIQQAGLMVGQGGNRFDPQSSLTRAEFAAVLQRFITQILKQ